MLSNTLAWLSASSEGSTSKSRSIVRFSTAPSEQDDHQQGDAGRETHHLDGADGRRVVRGPDHHGGVGRQLGQQAGGPLEHVLHLPVHLLEEGAHLLVLGRPEDPRLRQVVDEEAVALVGRDTPGTGVGLHEIPVTLQRHHFGPHGGRGDLHAGGAGHVRRADGLGAADVLGHDGFENGRLAVVQGAPSSAWGSTGPACLA